MNEDEKAKIYNQGVKSIQGHSQPSLLTLELIKSMEDKMEKFEEKISSKMEIILIKIAEMPEKLLEKCDAKYASKELEKDVQELRDDRRWLIKIILGAIILQILVQIGLKYA